MVQEGEGRQGKGQLCKGPEAQIVGVLSVLQNMGDGGEGARLQGAAGPQISPWMYPKSCSTAVESCSPSPPRSRQTRARVTWGLWQLD